MGEYVKKIGMRRILIMLLGNVFLGMGVSIFKFAGLGNDAYNAMMMALSDVVGIPYARFFAIFSVGLFVIELIAGRHFSAYLQNLVGCKIHIDFSAERKSEWKEQNG